MNSDTSTTRCCPVCRHDAGWTDHRLGGYRLARCPQCDLRFAAEAFGEEPDYDAVYQSNEYRTDQVENIMASFDPAEFMRIGTYQPFFTHVHPRAGATLLDIGCGVGRFCQAAAVNGWEVTGIDISSEAITIGRQYAKFRMEVSTVDELLAQAQRFNCITAFEVLEHTTDPVGFLHTARQLLAPHGTLFITVPHWGSPHVQTATRPDWLPPIHQLFFSRRALASACHHAGFTHATTGYVAETPRRWTRRVKRWWQQQFSPLPEWGLGLWLLAEEA